MNPLVVLGATGSIGRQALEVASARGIAVEALAAGGMSESLLELAGAVPDAEVAVATATREDVDRFRRATGRSLQVGQEAVVALAARKGRTVLNGIVGSAGLGATIAGLEAGNRVALANKESMVAAGALVREAWAEGGGELIPVDSEHSALHQCLAGEEPTDIRRIILTASGGPFRGRSRNDLEGVTASQALDHPTWDMGGRITIDSATLMNKGLEVIEAHHLFGVDFDAIDVVVHPQSIVHSAVEFVDGALKAHLGVPDMRIPIQYALTYPRRGPSLAAPFTLAGTELTFEEPDRVTFPALDLAYAAGRRGGTAPAVLNAADEEAVAAFLQGSVSFLQITEIVGATLEEVASPAATDLDGILAADAEARRVAREMIYRLGSDVGSLTP